MRPGFFIVFDGDEGIDEGGLVREYFLKLSQTIFSTDLGLF